MLLPNVLFTTYSIIFVSSAFLIIGSKNPVHSILFMVMCFFCASNLLIMISMEFAALLFLIIYVGAIAVLFLFVIMMMNIKVTVSNFNVLRYLPIGGLLGILLVLQLGKNVVAFGMSGDYLTQFGQEVQQFFDSTWSNWFFLGTKQDSICALGEVLYTYTYDLFILCSVVLLIAMLAAILLTLHTSIRRKPYIEKTVTHITSITSVK